MRLETLSITAAEPDFEVSPGTLGLKALKQQSRLDELVQSEANESYFSGPKTYEKNGLPFGINAAIKAARVDMLLIDPSYQSWTDPYCEGLVDLELVVSKASFERDNGPTPWSTWIPLESSNQQFIQFASSNLEAVDSMQKNQSVQLEIEKEKIEYADTLRVGVRDNWLHINALEAAEAVDKIKVYVGDAFDTHFIGRIGYHLPGMDWVVVGGESRHHAHRQGTLRNIRATTKHELNHAVLGALGARWLDEALTETIAYISANKREIKLNYLPEIDLLLAVNSRGNVDIPIDLYTRAYSEKYSTEAKDELFHAIGKAWSSRIPVGKDLLEGLEAFIERTEKAYIKSGEAPRKSQKLAIADAKNKLLNSPTELFQA